MVQVHVPSGVEVRVLFWAPKTVKLHIARINLIFRRLSLILRTPCPDYTSLCCFYTLLFLSVYRAVAWVDATSILFPLAPSPSAIRTLALPFDSLRLPRSSGLLETKSGSAGLIWSDEAINPDNGSDRFVCPHR